LIDLLMALLEPEMRRSPADIRMYPFDAGLNAARLVEVPRRTDFSLDLQAIRAAVAAHRPKIMFLAAPNNPDGSLPDAETIDALLDLPLLVVLDEAYIEFAGERLGAGLSRIHEASHRENLVVLRTFSKWAGLAGLRVGYGAFPGRLLPAMWKAKQPYNVNVAASVAALVSLAHADELAATVDRLKTERTPAKACMTSPTCRRILCSNFILCRWSDGMPRIQRPSRAGLRRPPAPFRETWFARPHSISVGRPQDTEYC
jgi:histidinol-phosphate aminotransferase